MIDGKQLGTVGFEKLGTPYSEMDCQAFVEWCLKRCGLDKNLAGSNAWYRECANHGAVMTPEACVRELGTVPAGAFLFILEHDGGEPEKYKADGLGNASHIGIVTGRGEGAIHSSKSRGCVAESKFKNKSISGGWNMVGLYDQVCFDYGSGSGSAAAEPDPAPAPVQKATVWAANGKPVKMRAVKGTTNSGTALYDELPVGTVVQVVERGDEWTKVNYGARRGWWIKSAFLVFGDVTIDPGEDAAAAVHIVEEPEQDFGPEDWGEGDDGDITITLKMSQDEAAELLSVVDRLQWQLVQVLGGRG